MKVKIKVLSPVHIGTGDNYTVYDYIVKEQTKTITFYNIGKFLDKATPDEAGTFSRAIREVRELKDMPKDILEKIERYRLYQIKYAGDRSPDGCEIEQFIKTVDNRIYIPGSEIKGAIRTAILYALIKQNKPIYENLVNGLEKIYHELHKKLLQKPSLMHRDEIKKLKNMIKRKIKDSEDELQKKLLRVPGKDDASFDLLRCLRVSDSSFLSAEDALEVRAERVKRVSVWQEFCKEGKELECEVEIDLGLCKEMRFHQQQVRCLEEFLVCCYEFYAEVLRYERVGSMYENTPEQPLLRIGKGQGFMSVTVNLYLYLLDKERKWGKLREILRGIYYSGRIGIEPGRRRVGGDSMGWVRLVKV